MKKETNKNFKDKVKNFPELYGLLGCIISAFLIILVFGSLIIFGGILAFSILDCFISPFSYLNLIKIFVSSIIVSIDIGVLMWLDIC